MVRLGAFLALIGFGSSLLHFTDVQLKYLIWAEPNQPWLGLGIGGVGAVVLLIHTLRGKDNTPEQAPAAQGAYGPPPGGYPPPGGGFAPAAGAPGGFAPQSPPVGFPAVGPAPQSPPQGFAPPAGYGAQPAAIPQQGPPVGQWQQQGPPQQRGPQGPPQQFGPQSGPPRG